MVMNDKDNAFGILEKTDYDRKILDLLEERTYRILTGNPARWKDL